jgi:hypothetical protein
MLTTTSPQLAKLSAREKLQRSYEDTDKALMQYRLSDHDDLKNAEKRMGKPMMSSELVKRIEKLTNRAVWAEDSYRDPDNVVGFYTIKKREKVHICAFDKGAMPEYSIIMTDAADLPIKEKRGWRTVLTRLMQADVLTWSQVQYGFGEGMNHAAANRWAFNTRDFRSK